MSGCWRPGRSRMRPDSRFSWPLAMSLACMYTRFGHYPTLRHFCVEAFGTGHERGQPHTLCCRARRSARRCRSVAVAVQGTAELAAAKLAQEKPGQTLDATGPVHEAIANTRNSAPAGLLGKSGAMSTHDESLILELDSPVATLERVGGKGASLARLAAAGLPVPPGFHITTLAYCRFVSENQLAESILAAAAQAKGDDPATLDTASAQIQSLIAQGTIPDDIAALIRREYAALGGDDPPVAVRSSATAEDLPEMSFAGQQDTYLNVRGGDGVLEAVKRCWASLWTARALGYRARHGIRPEDVALAVVVQQLVPADVAGVLFTANPMTGCRDQVMINAAWGLGEAIVGGHVTPDTLTVDKPTGVIGSQEIADKDVMTVRSAGGTREEPVPADRRKQPALQPPQAAELTRLGVQIEQLYGMPMDVEWALYDGRPFILQARPITALPEPRASLDWPLPSPKGKYGRTSVVELLPDPLSPLFATLALPLWNEGYRELMRAFGLTGMFPEEYLLTINDYAYYDYSKISGWRMIIALPRLVPRARDWLRRAITRWADDARPRYVAVVDAWSARDLGATPAAQLLDGAREIARMAAEHYLTIQSGILPAAAMAEALFTFAYNRLARRKDDPPALTFLLGFDSAPIQAEKSLYDLATWARIATRAGRLSLACRERRDCRGVSIAVRARGRRGVLARVQPPVRRAPQPIRPCRL